MAGGSGGGADLPVSASARHGLRHPVRSRCTSMAVLTNTTPIGVTRGPGFAETVNILERLIDAAARQCGFDRAELRRRNMVPADGDADDQRASASRSTAAHFAETFDRALALADVAGFAARRRESEARGKLRGLGFAYHIKGTGGSPHENVDIRFEPDGTRVADHRHADYRPGARDDLSADPGRPAGRRQRADHAAPGRHRPDPDGRRPWQFARDLHGRHRDLARVGSDRRQGQARVRRGAGGGRGRHSSSTTARFVVPGTDLAIGLLDVAAAGAGGRHAARHLSRLDARAPDLPQRHACRRGRDRPRHRRRRRWCATPRSTITACWSIR